MGDHRTKGSGLTETERSPESDVALSLDLLAASISPAPDSQLLAAGATEIYYLRQRVTTLQAVEQKYERLRGVIEDAPHNRTCPASQWNDWMLDLPRPCTCWKAGSLA